MTSRLPSAGERCNAPADILTMEAMAELVCERFILEPQRKEGRPGLAIPAGCLRGNGCECWHETALPAALDLMEIADNGPRVR